MKYPALFKVNERHTDPYYFLVENSEQLEEQSLEAFKWLKPRMYVPEKPNKNQFQNIPQEQIANAPTEEVKRNLEEYLRRKKVWEEGSYNTRGSYKRAKDEYDLWQKAEKGDGKAAYTFLLEYTDYLREVNLNYYPNEKS